MTACDEDELATRLSLAVLTGHNVPTEHRVSPTLARFEALVENLVHR